jgi:hypothetical protein
MARGIDYNTIYGGYYSSGSCNVVSSDPVVSIWKCHYCGSKHPVEELKCSGCGGERRDEVEDRDIRAKIKYIEQEKIIWSYD